MTLKFAKSVNHHRYLVAPPSFAGVVALVLTLLSSVSFAAPKDPYNQPVSISWWKVSCKSAYLDEDSSSYAKGFCNGVMLAYLNQEKRWCVPDEVTWGEVQTYLGSAVAQDEDIHANSTKNIEDWISLELQKRWPCDD